MITNKIINILISITAFFVIPVQFITTFVLGIIVNLTFGLLLIPLSIIWIVLFLGPLLGLSYVYENFPISRPFVSIIGIPLALIADTYVALIPSMGEKDSRFSKLLYCQTFPYTWTFNKFYTQKFDISKNDVFNKILTEVSTAEPLALFLEEIKMRHEKPNE